MPPRIKLEEAIILAGGQGTRLQSVWKGPKVLASVAGRPFLAHLLDQLSANGVLRVIICTGYQGALVESTFGATYRSMSLVYSHEMKPLGTAGALRHAVDKVESDPFLVLNGDSWCKVNLVDFLVWHNQRDRSGSILLTAIQDISRYGGVTMGVDDSITMFHEKERSGPGWINAGIYFLSKKMVSEIPHGSPISLEREVFPKWIGRDLYGFRGGGKFLDIGTPESYAAAERFFTTSC